MGDQRIVRTPDGVEHRFPAEATDAQIQEALQSIAPSPNSQSGAGSVTGNIASSAWDSAKNLVKSARQGTEDVLEGAAKSLISPVIGGGQLIRSALGMPKATEDPHSLQIPINPNATNTTQKVGKFAGETAQYFVPAGAIAKANTALKTGSGVLNALIKAGLEGTSAAGVHTLQTGSTEGALDTGVLTGATGLATTIASNLLAKPIGYLGERIERALLKPTGPALDGMTPAQLVKKVYANDVGGTLGQTYDKTAGKIKQGVDQLKGILRQSSTLGGSVNLDDVAQKTSSQFLDNPQAQKALQQIADHVKFQLNANGIPDASKLDLADGNLAKQAVGDLGAWTHGMRGNTVADASDVNVLQQVANKFYNNLKTDIESKALGPVKSINQKLSDLMSIRQAVVRRIPIAERQNVLSLSDNLNLSAHTFGIGLLNRILGSGLAANALVKTSDALGHNAPAIGTVAGRIAGNAIPKKDDQ